MRHTGLFTVIACGALIGCSNGGTTTNEAVELQQSESIVDESYAPKGPIEQKYMAVGPWSVTEATTSETCDRKLQRCDLFYPSELGTNPLLGIASGFHHPIISWANGSGQLATKYAYFLRHLASWGFIVVAARDEFTLDGATTIDAANYIIEQGGTSGSLFYDKVDANRVGAAGHSQGGGSAVALFAHQEAPFSAFVAIHPSPHYFAVPVSNIVSTCITPELCALSLGVGDFANARSGAILYLNSVGDGGMDDTQMYYDETLDAATKAFGVVALASHEDVMGDPDCLPNSNCITGVYAYLGYPTAWFMWKLQDASDGPEAFNAETGEFNRPTPDWQRNMSNVR